MRFLGCSLAMVMVLGVLGCSRSEKSAPPKPAEVEHEEEIDAGTEEGLVCEGTGVSKTPWVVAIDETSAKIRWEACREGVAPELTWKAESGGEAKTAVANVAPFVVPVSFKISLIPDGPHDWAGTYYMHEVALTGLEPSTCYTYELSADASAKGRFCTARKPGESFRFLVIGDTNPSLSPATSQVLEQNLPANPDFAVHTGDLQYYDSFIETWASWWPGMKPLLAQGAFLPSVGNHEFEKPNEFELYYKRFFDGAGFDGTTRYYRFSTGGVWFFSVDTEQELGLDSPQGKWLTEGLAFARKQPGYRFSIVYLHRPWITCGDSGDDPERRETWEPVFIENDVKLVLFGHMHGYERFEVPGLTYVVSGGGGGLLSDVDENADKPFCEMRKASGRFYNATIVEVGPSAIHGITKDHKGEVRDEFQIPL